MMILLLIVLFSVSLDAQANISYSLLNQTNGYTLYFDLTNRVECHNYTDFWGYPLVCVADDFILPSFVNLDMSRDCTGLSLNFTTIRLRVDMDPLSITIRLFRHNTSNNGPSDTAFYTRTMCSPDGTCKWPTRLNTPSVTSITLHNGDPDDNGSSVFNLAALPTGETLWVSIYVSVPDHPSTTILKENSLYWMTLENKSTSTPLQKTFYDGTPNYNYKYIDVNNLHRNGFTSWTDATVVQPLLGVSTTTFNMAWSVSLICQSGTTFLLSFPPTESPTSSPTTATPTMAPTYAPTIAPTSEPTSEPTTLNDTTTGNETMWYEKYIREQTREQIIIYSILGATLFLFSLCCCVCLCIKCYRYRKKGGGPISINTFLGKHKSDSEIEMGPIVTTFSEYHREKDEEIDASSYESVAKKRANIPPERRSYTSRETYTEVSLSDDHSKNHALYNADEQGQLANWINDIIPTTEMVGGAHKKDI